MSLKIVPTNFPVGAEILGLDMALPIGDNLIAKLDQALGEYGVIFFRNQMLTPNHQLSITSRFGEIVHNTFGDSHGLNGYPDIVVISNIEENGIEIGVKAAGENWHSDMCYTKKPPRGTIMYAHEVPKQNGLTLGDTCFAACHAAYDALPAEMKKHLASLSATFDFAGRNRQSPITQDQIISFPPVIHPIVRTHPVTKRHCLYVMRDDCTAIDELEQNEADSLIAALADHIVRPEFVYRHQWQPGDLLIWDNCTVQHMAIQDYTLPNKRLMHRTTFAADAVPT